MLKTNMVIRLFSDSYKYESWVQIEKEIVNFLFEKGKIDDSYLKKSVDFLNVGAFEVLGLLKEHEFEFERFLELIFSKGSCFNNPYVIAFLDKHNFEGTSLSLIIKHFNDYLLSELNFLLKDLKKLAEDYKYVVQIGRTHGVYAEPTSVGHKFLICYSDVERSIEFIEIIRKYIEVVFINYSCCWDSDISVELQDYLSLKLGLHVDTSFSNWCFRERYVRYCSLFNSISQNIYKLFLDLKFMYESELGEISCLDFDVIFEKIETCSKIIESNVIAFSSMIDVYDEFGNSNKSLEKSYLREAASSLISLITYSRKAFSELKFNKAILDKKLENSRELIYSQAFMLHILKQGAFGRDEVLEDLKLLAIKARDDYSSFSDMLLSSPKYKGFFSKKDVKEIMSPLTNLKNIDLIYERAFGKSLDLFKNILCGENEIEEIISQIASRLNIFYKLEREPVAVIAFSDRSLFVLGALLPRLNFSLTTIIFSSRNIFDGEIGSLVFDKSLIQSRRVLIVDYAFMNPDVFLSSFIKKLREFVFVRDIRVFCMLKGSEIQEFKLGWWGKECNSKVDYAGFGRDFDSAGLVCLPLIGDFL